MTLSSSLNCSASLKAKHLDFSFLIWYSVGGSLIGATPFCTMKKLPATAILGVDPGVNGGLALADTKKKVIYYTAMPKNMENFGYFCNALTPIKNRKMYIEHMSYAQVGRKDAEGKFIRISNPRSMGVLGQNAGFLQGNAMAMGYKIEEVWPQSWMGRIGAHDTGLSCNDKGWKNNLKRIAAESFPSAKVTLKNADAFLILLDAYRRLVEDPEASMADWEVIQVKF